MRPEDTAGFGPVGTNATAPQPLTAARRAEIRARHKDTRRILPGCECSVCLAPADIAALLAEVERLRGVIRHVIAMDAVSLGWKAELRAEIGEDSHG